jgi:hypothetical protein
MHILILRVGEGRTVQREVRHPPHVFSALLKVLQQEEVQGA